MKKLLITLLILCTCCLLYAQTITNAEYFIDTDPGIGSATPVVITSGVTIQNAIFDAAISSLTDGVHELYFRVKDSNGYWSITIGTPFFKQAITQVGQAANITDGEYFIDTDPGIGGGTILTISSGLIISNLAFQINTNNLTQGSHTIYTRFKDANGIWSITRSSDFSVCNQSSTTASAATNVTTTGITANWAAVSGATGYQLDVSTDNFATFVSGYNAKLVTTTSQMVTGLTANTAYQIRVRALGTCTSVNSNVVNVTTLTAAPTATAATNITSSGFTANWNTVTGATGYQLDVSTDNFATFVNNSISISGISQSITGANSGTTYQYRVRAVNATGSSANSNSISATTTSVVKQSQTITFASLAAKTVGDAAFDLTATASSTLAVSYTSSNTAVATISGKTVTIVGAGTSTITASQAGNTNYNAATSVTQTLTVNPVADIVIKQNNATIATNGSYDFGNVNMLANSGAITFNITNPTTTVALVVDVNASGLSGINAADFSVDYTGLPNGTSTIKFTPSASGVRTAVLSVVSNATGKSPYIINLKGTGVKLTQTITFAALPAKSTTDAAFDLSATSTNTTLPIAYTSSNASVAAISGKTVTIVGVGTSTITASQVGDVNYSDATPVTQTLTVNTKQNQTITFASLTAKKFGDAAFTLGATSSSSLAVSYTSSNLNVATVAGSTVTIVGVGTSTITASQAGNTTFNPASDVTQTLTVGKGDQTITFGTVAAKALGDAAFTLGATASSSLAVAYTTTSDKVTIAGSTVTLVKAGSVTISAVQAGNANYNAALQVQQTFCINPAKPTITISNGNTETPTLTSSAAAGNQWYKNGTAIAGATNATLSVTAAGVYSVEATVETCKSARAADFPIIVTGDIVSYGAKVLEISPNPTSDYILMKLPGEGKKEIGIFNPSGGLQEGTATEQNQVTLDVRNYAAGYYLVRVSTATEIYYGKFIKK